MEKSTVTIYTPDSSLRHPASMLRDMFHDLLAGRELAWRLAVRDISAQYRQTYLGFLWVLIMPLANTLTWVFLSGSGIIAVADTDLPYPVYVFVGTTLWGVFIDALNAPLQQTNAAKSMLAKLNFPKEALILSGIYKSLFNAGIKILILLLAVLFMGISPSWSLVLFPFALLSLILFGNTLGLLLTPVGMLYTDISRAIPLVSQFLMYLTPVVYPMPAAGWASTLVLLNPVTPLILTGRSWLTGSSAEYLLYFVIINLLTGVVLLVAWMMYRLAIPILVERISA